MGTEEFLQFWHSHLNTIIGILMVSVVLLLGLYLFLEFIKEKKQSVDGEVPGAGNFDQIEASLKKLLDNAQPPTAGAAVAGGDSEITEKMQEEMTELQQMLAEKEKLINELKETTSQGEGGGGGDTSALEEKIKDLEARLMEYEIIEDDIADLSMYKEENTELKKQLEALQGQAPSGEAAAPPAEEASPPPAEEAAPPAAEEPAPEPEPAAAEPPPAEEAPPVEAEPATTAESAAEPVPAPETTAESTPAEAEEDLGDDIMAEFAAAVQEQKEGEISEVETAEIKAEAPASASVEEPVPEETFETPPEPEDTPPRVAAEANDDDDPPLPKDPVAQAASQIDLDGLIPDTEKMLDEVEELNASAQADDGSDALSGEVDTEKMLNEMNELNSLSGTEDSGEQKKLASEFDNFIKES